MLDFRRRFLLCLGSLIGACESSDSRAGELLDPEGAGRPQQDAGQPHDAGRMLDAARAVPTVCPTDVQVCSVSEAPRFAVLMEARSFGEGAELVAVSGESVLIRGGSVPWRVATQVDLWGGPGPVTIEELPSGRWNALDLDDRRYFERSLDVLACELDRGVCLLLTTGDQTSSLVELTGSELPSTFEAHGLAGRCVFGRGIMCFDGSWQTLLDPSLLESDERIELYTGDLAGSSKGHIWRRRQSTDGGAQPDWQRDESFETARLGKLRGFDLGWDGQLALYGERGFLSFDRSKPVDAGASFCGTDSPLASMFEAGSLLVSTSGELIFGGARSVPPRRWCSDRSLVGLGPIVGQTVTHCGLSNNPRLLTATALLAAWNCVID